MKILTVAIASEQDIVLARHRARDIAALLGFDRTDQTRMATAVSEIARNAHQYAGSGKVEFSLEGVMAPQLFLVRISDRGRGIRELDRVLSGAYVSSTGMGLGISGARRLVDQFHIQSGESGTVITLKKLLPAGSRLVAPEHLPAMMDELARREPASPYQEVKKQNHELLLALEELRSRQEELAQLNSELEDTNRGVVALYAELDERADHLRRADELKSRFLSNMSHEFRTPLNSIMALTGLLLDRADGDLTAEQEKQVTLVRRSAQDLYDLVNDLLDLAKVEAGKIAVHPADFEVASLFGALRGMLRPLLVTDTVTLVFDEPPKGFPELYTDEAKVSQILRNFISNALKFTERGEIRVSAELDEGAQTVTFRVSDTGIGIAPEDQERIFQEFSQLDHPIQKKVKGTGLGLPLSRRLAELLGGSLGVTSHVGAGSTFYAVIPVDYRVVSAETILPAVEPEPMRIPILVVEDESETRLVYEKYLRDSAFQMFPARTVREARAQLRRIPPAAIILDILLPGEDAWMLLAELKRDPSTCAIPVLVITSVDDERKGAALGADAYCLKPVARATLLSRLTELTAAARQRALIIDDDETSRYILRRHLIPRQVLEANSGPDGLRLAVEQKPDVIFLDLMMPGMTGFEVLERLKSAPETQRIPVFIVTSKTLTAAERGRLQAAEMVLSKQELSAEQISRSLARFGLELHPSYEVR